MMTSFRSWILAAALATVASGTKCGKWYSSDCVADTDIRYDEDYTNNLKDLNDLWKNVDGFWQVEFLIDVDPNTNQLRTPTFYNPNIPVASAVAAPYIARQAFYNESFDGSRYTANRYYFFGPPNETFCEEQVPPGFANVVGEDGVCGETGYSVSANVFGVSSYEKDGTISAFQVEGFYGSSRPEYKGSLGPVGETTYVYSVDNPPFGSGSNSWVFLRNFTEFSLITSNFNTAIPGASPLQNIVVARGARVTEEEFVQGIEEAYTTWNVPESSRIQGGELPMETYCVVDDACPSEEDWCELDPECSESPYQEPDATIKAGPIIGFVLLGVVILAIAFYFWHRHQLAMLNAKNRAVFARRIAETIELKGSHRVLTPEALAKEFHMIDGSQTKDGKISKDELWEFLSSGKAGEISKSDFNALFVAMDLDGDGEIEFTEFVAYFGQCEHDFENVKNRQSVLANRASRRDLLSASAANLHSSVNVPEKIEEGAEEEAVEQAPSEDKVEES